MIFPVAVAAFKRTPIAKARRELACVSAVELVSCAARQLVSCEPHLFSAIGAVVYGASRLAGQGPNPARMFAHNTGIPRSVPAHTVSSACSSGVDAVLSAMRIIALGEADVVLAGAAESMSGTPKALFREYAHDNVYSFDDLHLRDGLRCPHTGMTMLEIAEAFARRRGMTRSSCDEFAIRSHERYAANKDIHQKDIVPVSTPSGDVTADMLPRGSEELERVPALKAIFGDGCILTPATVAAIADGGCAMLLCKSELLPGSPILKAYTRVGGEPHDSLLMPAAALRKLEKVISKPLGEIGHIEINEGFAPVTLACCEEAGLELDSVNRFGGALATGHPTGMSGMRILGLAGRLVRDGVVEDAAIVLPVSGGLGYAVYLSGGKDGG